MSLVIARVGPERAWLAADTEAGFAHVDADPADRVEGCKLLPLPHLNAALAVAGNTGLLSILTVRIASSAATFDQVCNEFVAGGLLDEAFENYQGFAAANDVRMLDSQLVAIVGWSAYLNRFRGLLAQREAGKWKTFEFGHLLSPALPDDPVPAMLDDLVDVARRQVLQTREQLPGVPIGGRLIAVELTIDAMTITRHYLED